MSSDSHTFIDRKLVIGDYHFRFCNFFDNDAKRFEEILVKNQPRTSHLIRDDEGIEQLVEWPNITFWQSHRYNCKSKIPFYLLQMTNSHTQKHYQAIIHVEISKVHFFKKGIIKRWVISTIEDQLLDQQNFLKQLTIFCNNLTDLMTLQLQLYLPGDDAISEATSLITSMGFLKCASTTYEKSRFIDLRPNIEETFKRISPRKRTQIRMNRVDHFAIQKINDVSVIPVLESALNHSYQRSIGASSNFHFAPMFSLGIEYPEEVIKLGFCLANEPKIPKAFVFGLNHREVFEYSVGGSFSDVNLRKYPFNLILMWQLILEAKNTGCSLFDLGGITSGQSNDPLSGVSNFKRSFPGFEMKVSQEMRLILRPLRLKLYLSIQNMINFIKRKL